MNRCPPALWAHATGHPPGLQPPQQRLHCRISNFQCGWRQWLPPAAWALQPEAPRAPSAGDRPAGWTSVPCGAVWRVQVGRRGTALAAAAAAAGRCLCPTRLPVAVALTCRCVHPPPCSQPCGDQRRHQQRRWQRQRHLRPPHPVGRLLRGPRLRRCRRQRERRPPCVHPGWRLWRAVHGGQAGEPDLAARHQAQGEPLCIMDRQAPAAGCHGQARASCALLEPRGCQQHDSALPACWPLSRQPGACSRPTQVTLIDQSDRFVFKPLLYELLSGAASEEEVAPPFAQLLAPYPVTFVQGRVASVQPEHATQVGPARTAQLLPAWPTVAQCFCGMAHCSHPCAQPPTSRSCARSPLPRMAAPLAAAPWCWQTGTQCPTTGWWCHWAPRPPRSGCPA